MAKYLPLPKSLKEADVSLIQSLIAATEEVFKGDLFGENNRPLTEEYTTADGKYHWSTNKDFLLYITDLTLTENVRAANTALYQALSRPSEQAGSSMPDKFLREEQEELRARSEAELEETQKSSQRVVETATERKIALHNERVKESEIAKEPAIKTPQSQAETEAEETQKKAGIDEPETNVAVEVDKQKILYQEQIVKEKVASTVLTGQAIYYKVKSPSLNETPEIKGLKEQAQADPKRFVEDTIKNFKSRATDIAEFQKLTPEETDVIVKQAAITTQEVLSGNSPIIAARILRVVSDPEILNRITPNIQTRETLKNACSDLYDQKIAQFEIAKRFIDLSEIDGFTSVEDVVIEVSDNEDADFEKFDIEEQIFSPHIDSLETQSELLDSLKDLVGDKAEDVKSQLLLKAGAWLDGQIAKLPAGSALAKFYNSELVQLGLSRLGIAEGVTWVTAEGSWLGRAIVSSGYGNVAGFIQAKTGIDLGIKRVIGEIGKKAIEKAGGQTAGQAVGKAAAGLLPKLFAALGALSSWATLGLSLLAGYILGKIAEKIDWKKVKKASIAILGGAWAMTYGRRIVKRVGRFFGRLLKNFAITVFNPLLIIILAFPVLVVITLFIINSGAYIVPPSGSSVEPGNPYVEVKKTVVPNTPHENTDIPFSVDYTITISAKKDTLTNIVFRDDCKVNKTGSSPACPTPSQPIPDAPGSISPAVPFTFSYSLRFDSHDFDDSTVVNTFTVAADTAGQGNILSSTSATVVIGAAPMNCPNDAWPLAGDAGMSLVSQGPNGAWSHSGMEAIDIGVDGTPIVAIHNGTVSTGENSCGRWVTVASTCGSSFVSMYGHLGAITVSNGQNVTVGQELGISDNSGYPACSTGPHLHFEFIKNGESPKVQKPFLKRDVPVGCVDFPACN